MADSENKTAPFVEVQKFTQKWLWALVGIIALIAWATFVQQIVRGTPVGNHPAPNIVVWIILVLFGIGMPWYLLSMRLITRVEPPRLFIRLRPLMNRAIPLSEIASCEATTYRPMRDFGGRGIRFSPKLGRAYSVSGDRGVQLVLTDGKKVLIGSQRAEELAGAINKSLGAGGS